MPSHETFSIPPIEEFVKRYLQSAKVSIDPFAGNKDWATYTNDLNPNTSAQHHLDAQEYCEWLRECMVKPDLVIFDPPYSPRQISECYKSFGREPTTQDTQNAALYARVRNAFAPMIPVGGVVLSFGWNTSGMGKKHGFEQIEILLVCHGGAHNDTICMAERRVIGVVAVDESDGVLRKLDEKMAARIDAFRESERLSEEDFRIHINVTQI